MAKTNPLPQEGKGIHNGRKHPDVESVRDAKHNPKPKVAAIGDFRASTGQEK
jgi:hypothetical protein